MQLPHQLDGFGEFIEEVAGDSNSRLGVASMVEKDYWITHALWSLQGGGVPFVFKGGTALSKAMGITNRFSEDLDLIVDAPSSWGPMPPVSSWKSDKPKAIKSREVYWTEYVARLINTLPDFTLELDPEADEQYRNVKVRAKYQGAHTAQLAAIGSSLKPFVLLELAYNDPARNATDPSLVRTLDSEVHATLRRKSAADELQANRPIKCAVRASNTDALGKA